MYKWREGYLVSTWARKVTCWCFDWMLQSSSGQKYLMYRWFSWGVASLPESKSQVSSVVFGAAVFKIQARKHYYIGSLSSVPSLKVRGPLYTCKPSICGSKNMSDETRYPHLRGKMLYHESEAFSLARRFQLSWKPPFPTVIHDSLKCHHTLLLLCHLLL